MSLIQLTQQIALYLSKAVQGLYCNCHVIGILFLNKAGSCWYVLSFYVLFLGVLVHFLEISQSRKLETWEFYTQHGKPNHKVKGPFVLKA